MQVATKLVESDFKHGRVEDITQVSEKQQQKIKKYCKEYFEKAVAKQRAHEKKKADRKQGDSTTPQAQAGSPEDDTSITPTNNKDPESDRDFDMDQDGGDSEQQQEPATKRKRGKTDDDDDAAEADRGNASPMKRPKSSTPLLDRQSSASEVEVEDEERLDGELPHAGLAASSHQSIGVVQ